jgi:adenylate cyclase class IV
MTPKEKAKEMYIKFDFVYVQNYTSKFEVKRCALIAVDEIMNVCPFVGIEFATSEGGKESDAKEYWQQVKQEIEKL